MCRLSGNFDRTQPQNSHPTPKFQLKLLQLLFGLFFELFDSACEQILRIVNLVFVSDELQLLSHVLKVDRLNTPKAAAGLTQAYLVACCVCESQPNELEIAATPQ